MAVRKKPVGTTVEVRPTLAPMPQDAQIAPWPLIDKFPTVIGSNLSMAHISAIMRLAQTGYRREYVDLLDELLEREPHGFAVLSQRVLIVAGGRVELSPATSGGIFDHGAPLGNIAGRKGVDTEIEKAWEITDFVRSALDAIPDMMQSIADLMWAVYYGASCLETQWGHDARGRWVPRRLHFVHSRRINYPDPSSWRAHIWDQGLVKDWKWGSEPTAWQTFGIPIDDYPGKFILHNPKIRGDYPTRDGLGRQLVYWFALKGMSARGAGQYIERFGKPWVTGKFRTKPDGIPRAANQEDVDKLDAAVRALGIGSLAGATLPDSVDVEIQGPGVRSIGRVLTHSQFIELINKEISKATLGETLTTEVDRQGARAMAEIHKEGAREVARYDAGVLSQTIQQQLVAWIVRFNYPGFEHLTPQVRVVIERPDPKVLVDMAKVASEIDLPVDADWLAEETGLRLIAPEAAATSTRRTRWLGAKFTPSSDAGPVENKDGTPNDVAPANGVADHAPTASGAN